MERARLADRLREILNAPAARTAPIRPDAAPAPPVEPLPGGCTLEQALDGRWCGEAPGSCFLVERRFETDAAYGRVRVGDLADGVQRGAGAAALLAGGAPVAPPFVFFDLETTGLSGGAGTYAFLVGFGSFDEGGRFVTRQHLMTRHAGERALLGAVHDQLSQAGALVSFNGKSFDAPVLETRYLFHRLAWPGARLPHLDILHPARRFWGEARLKPHATGAVSPRPNPGGLGGVRLQPDDGETSCSLAALERQILGARQSGDVPGFEIPARYFQFVRSGDARPLAGVLEHNRLDLLSLAGLTARLLHLVSTGPAAARDAREALALGRVYEQAGLDGRAREAYEHAVGETQPGSGAASIVNGAAAGAIRIAALRALALTARRGRRYEESAGRWRQLLDVRPCPPHIAREATEALAVHHEHRVRDLIAARTFALRSLAPGISQARNEAVRHRLARIDRKLAGEKTGALLEPFEDGAF